VCIIGLFGVLSKLYLLLVLEILVHAYLPNVYHMACFTFFEPIYRINSKNPNLAKMCMKFNFISICTYLCGVYPIYCSCLTISDPISLGTILYLILC
jgi:hypothetical protein